MGRARLLAVWWLNAGAGLGTNAIARHDGLDPAAVSRMLRRAWRDRDPAFEAWQAALSAGSAGPVAQVAQVPTIHR